MNNARADRDDGRTEDDKPAPVRTGRPTGPLSALAAMARESPPEPADDGTNEAIGQVVAQVRELAATVGELPAQLADIRAELQQLRSSGEIISDQHERLRALEERHYERNVLAPVCLALIGVTDRAGTQAQEAEANLEGVRGRPNTAAHRALEYIFDARSADRIELQACLAQFGVETFEEPGEQFQPSSQKCLRRLPAPCPEREGRIARRLLPGYRRGRQVLRPEYVEVYVAAESLKNTENPKTGELQ